MRGLGGDGASLTKKAHAVRRQRACDSEVPTDRGARGRRVFRGLLSFGGDLRFVKRSQTPRFVMPFVFRDPLFDPRHRFHNSNGSARRAAGDETRHQRFNDSDHLQALLPSREYDSTPPSADIAFVRERPRRLSDRIPTAMTREG